jgi:hypothetical protein
VRPPEFQITDTEKKKKSKVYEEKEEHIPTEESGPLRKEIHPSFVSAQAS